MANTTSGAYSFDQDFSIDEIIADAYERIGLVGSAGHQLKTARRSLNILGGILWQTHRLMVRLDPKKDFNRSIKLLAQEL